MTASEAPERPICSCGEPMIAIRNTGAHLCPHCDQFCEKNESNCINHRNLQRATTRKHETTAPPADLRRDK